jgi:hypothetical protein
LRIICVGLSRKDPIALVQSKHFSCEGKPSGKTFPGSLHLLRTVSDKFLSCFVIRYMHWNTSEAKNRNFDTNWFKQ